MNIIELIDSRRHEYRSRIALQEFTDGGLRTITYEELARQRSRISAFLMERGIQKGDRVAVLSDGRIAWGAAFFGVIEAGGILVPLDVKLKEPEFLAILNHAEASALLVSPKYERTAQSLKAQVPSLAHVLVLGDQSSSWPALGQLPEGGVAASRRNLTDDDLALIVYTSGTTGNPKGVEIACGSLRFEVESFDALLRYQESDEFLSILPVNHLFEITGGFLGPLYHGCTVTYCHSIKPTDLLKAMAQTGTSVMLVVPLVLKMLRDALLKKIEAQPPAKRRLFRVLFGLSMRLETVGIHAGRLLFRPMHEAIGGRLRCFVCGGAPLDAELARELAALGLPVLQGYGLTETAPVISGNSLRANRLGSVGKPLPGVEVKIVPADGGAPGEGEIVTRGPNVMRGYFRNPTATAEVLSEGWFHTGDLGYFDRDGYLFISGRIKNLIVTGGGKKVQPEEVEELFERSAYIKELCVLGRPASGGLKAGTDEVFAVIVPSEDGFKAAGKPFDEPAIRAVLEQELAELGKQLADYKRPVGFTVSLEELPKTATKKIKRLEVRNRLLDSGKLS